MKEYECSTEDGLSLDYSLKPCNYSEFGSCKTRRDLCLKCPTNRNTEKEMNGISKRFINPACWGPSEIGIEVTPSS